MNFLSAELDIMVRWIEERESIRERRIQGTPKPWTSDPLLRDYRWCNARRMDDKVSQWLLRNWYSAGGTTPAEDLTMATFARLVNWPDSLREVNRQGSNWFHNSLAMLAAEAALAKRAQHGDKVFTGAYIVPGVPGMSKVASAMRTVVAVRDSADSIFGASMRHTWENLRTIDGLGSFLAGQIVADVAHLATGEHWPDRKTWAPLGPGSMRGINRLTGRPVAAIVRQDQFDLALTALTGTLHIFVKRAIMQRLHAMDVQNCLCEFDKYRRLQLGEGTVRARYNGKSPGMFAPEAQRT